MLNDLCGREGRKKGKVKMLYEFLGQALRKRTEEQLIMGQKRNRYSRIEQRVEEGQA